MARECSYKRRGKVMEEFLASMEKGTLPVRWHIKPMLEEVQDSRGAGK
jgi:hypothetical protein